jgi:cobyrinic acid a,c-diamide synthase
MTKAIMVAGLGGGAGKSVVAVGLAAAFASQGRRVVPFKKGPDYIDAGWMQLAAGQPCYNLDPYLMSETAIRDSFIIHADGAEIVVVEGNRGLYDGVNLEGSYSTAELAVMLEIPVLLVVNCTKTTRTVAAMVLGCQQFDQRVRIRGVILNQVGTARHEKIVRQAVEHYTGIPVLGAVPRMKTDIFPQRHLGITPYQEYNGAEKASRKLADIAAEYLDLQRIEEVMNDISVTDKKETGEEPQKSNGTSVRIGILKDAAFQFYYPENIEGLKKEGVEIVEINAMTDSALPELDALYIGGGFPETSARRLSENKVFRESVLHAAESGLPVYAECGGLIYLGNSITLDDVEYPLVGVFPVKFGLEKKPQAHGYTILKISGENPFYHQGEELKGHEFRYSKVLAWQGSSDDLALTMQRGVGFVDGKDGLVYKNVLALYTHVHAVATPQWAGSLVAKAREFKESR